MTDYPEMKWPSPPPEFLEALEWFSTPGNVQAALDDVADDYEARNELLDTLEKVLEVANKALEAQRALDKRTDACRARAEDN